MSICGKSLLLCLSLSAPWAAAQTLRVCTDVRPHPPLMTAQHDGVVEQLLRRAAVQAGLTVEFYAAPIARCRIDIRQGTADAFPITPYLPQELPNVRYPMRDGAVDRARGIATLRSTVLKRTSDLTAWDGTRFTHLDGPVLTNFSSLLMIELLTRRGIPFDASAKSLQDNLAKLLAGRGGALLALEAEATRLLADPALAGRIEAAPAPFSDETYYVAVSARFYAAHPEPSERLWDALGRLRAAAAR